MTVQQLSAEHSPDDVEGTDRPEPVVQLMAWAVHLYTAIGLVLAAWIAVLLIRGGPEAIRTAFVLMVVATLVDATDGTMARRIGVKRILPRFDGRKLDDITDFLTYTFLPLLLIWRAEVLPEGQAGWLLLPLLASAYGFCQVDIKTDDGFFLGFPSLWNVVAFYLYLLPLPGWAAVVILMVLGLLTFIPSRYLYPSQPGRLNVLSNILAAVWVLMLSAILVLMPAGAYPTAEGAIYALTLLSLFYPAFYMTASWTITLRRWMTDLA